MNSLMDMASAPGIWLTKELGAVSVVIEKHLNNKHVSVNELCGELATYRGKMLRPSLLLLSWKIINPNQKTPNSVRVAAGVVELIHLATLVHDDVLDDADMRRGKQSINSLCGNEAAVMLGDYLLSSAFLLCSTLNNPNLNLLLGEVTNTICAGEILQLSQRNNVDLSLAQYFQIIRDKTASLISSCCEMGATLALGKPDQVDAMRCFGYRVGVAFQIKDDLLDLLGEKECIGKPAGRDIEKGKLTLPVILMLKNHPELKVVVSELIKNNDRSSLREMLADCDSISQSREEINTLVSDAIQSINSVFSNEISTLLCALVEQIKVDRT